MFESMKGMMYTQAQIAEMKKAEERRGNVLATAHVSLFFGYELLCAALLHGAIMIAAALIVFSAHLFIANRAWNRKMIS